MRNGSFQRVSLLAAGVAAVLVPAFVALSSPAQTSPVNQPSPNPAAQGAGLIRNAPGAYKGYTLITPDRSTAAYLVDMEGKVVHSWETGATPGAYGYLLENGHLLRAAAAPTNPYGGFVAGGGGRTQEFDWNGDLVWEYTYISSTVVPHHDFMKLPNGNVLLLTKEKKTSAEAIASGRLPGSVQNSDLQPDALIEIKPTGKTTGDVVWEWHLWDHLIQDLDNTKSNFGDVAARPERLDINFTVTAGGRGNPDWAHANAIAYNADLDQIAISLRSMSEIVVIDHSTSAKEAAGSAGGRSGKGGDFLYRWGNPQAYRRGTAADQRSFGQHNVQWIAKGLRGAGNLLLFNNGDSRPGAANEKYSTVDEFVPPVDASGRYTLEVGKRYGPDQPVWSFAAPNKTDFYSYYISGTQRLPNGNTLICSGANGYVFEVTPEKQVVWQYNFPEFGGPVPGRGGAGPGGAGGRGGARGFMPSAQQGGPGGGPRGGVPGAGPGAGGGPRAGAAGAPRGGGGANNPHAIFRAYRYGPDFPGFAGKTLVAGKPIEEVVR